MNTSDGDENADRAIEAGTIAAVATTRPVYAFSVETNGCGCAIGQGHPSCRRRSGSRQAARCYRVETQSTSCGDDDDRDSGYIPCDCDDRHRYRVRCVLLPLLKVAAVLVTPGYAAAATTTVNVSALCVRPSSLDRLQRTVWPAAKQLQPAPTRETKLRPAGRTSVSVIVLGGGAESAAFNTVSV